MITTEVAISRVGLEGQGVGYDSEGNIYFVPGSLPGDQVRIEYPEDAKRYRDAVLLEILTPSSTRREPACAYFGECGGCDYLHWEYPSQLDAKKSSLAHTIERAGWDPSVVQNVLPSPKEFGYRNRIQIRRENGKTGFYKKGSHDIVDVEHCVVADPRVNEALKQIRATPYPAFGKEKVEIAISTGGETVVLKNRAHAAAGFQQVNAEQNENLKRLVAESVGVNSKKVLELYCGDGNLTFSYLTNVQEVMAIDSSEASIQMARNKKSAEDKVAFLALSVDGKLHRQLPAEFRKKYDTLIVDPPRQGMEGSLESWLHADLEKVIYISCSPVSFSKDAQCLKKDFVLSSVKPLDMFPHSHHIEFVSVFLRSHAPTPSN